MSGNLPTVKLLSHCLDFLHAHPSAFQPMVLLRFWSLDFCVWAGPLAVMAWFRIALVLSVSFRCPGTSWSFASGSHGAMSWLRSSLIGPTFQGLAAVDLSELYRSLAVFSPADQVFLRCHLDGTLFTQNARAKFKAEVSASCPWCSAKDGFHHRAWVCPHFAPCRAHLTPSQLEVLPSLPACLVDHGWPLLLPEWEVVAGMLLRDDGFCRMSPACPPDKGICPLLELFSDGTAAYPRDAKLRFAAWAVTMVSAQGVLDNQLLMGGHVTGLIQSPFRAELTAVLQAVKWAVQRQQKIRLWCDCQSVVGGSEQVASWKTSPAKCSSLRPLGSTT